ncbi:MAG: hypothetical protein A2156_03350 [Deltaproteobacteria bacterium RBG_16_48_10]|nr:MAG: hypothetical protein A2156_03350 [Deltaproteobacteria bacterium RBG_16_48_10]
MIPKEKLKIAILDHSPDLGGAESAILTLLKNIDRSRFDVTVILPSQGTFSKTLEESNISTSIIHLPMGLIRLKRGRALQSFLVLFVFLFLLQFFLLNLCIYLKKNHFQLILTNSVKAHLFGSVAACLCSIPLVWRFHDILSSNDFSPILIKFITLFGKLFPKRIFAVSEITRDHLVKNGIQSKKINMIFNAIDHERFETKGDFRNIRDEYQIGDGVKLVGCIGRIIPQKGQKVLLSAVPGVLERHPETLFLIIGGIFLKEEAYRRELLEIIEKSGIEKRAKLTGFRSDIGNIIRSLDLVVLPSIAPEAFPLSILEAMSLGKAVIASNIGGVKEIIEDGVNGLLVEPNRPEQITQKIIYLFNHQEIYDTIGQRAREVVIQKYSLRNYVKLMEKACWEVAIRERKFESRSYS